MPHCDNLLWRFGNLQSGITFKYTDHVHIYEHDDMALENEASVV